MIPYGEINDAADRRWTFRLLDRLSDNPSVKELADIIEVLLAVSDRRAVPILELLLIDRSQPAAIRKAAGTILRDMEHLDVEWPDTVLHGWFENGDPILREHAILSMHARACPDVVRTVAADRGHPFRRIALGRMEFGFTTIADLRLKVAALEDPDPAVRATVAAILFWDEPVLAEEPLITAARDPVVEVAIEAARTLQYYPSVRVIQCLYELREHPDDRMQRAVRGSLDEIRTECLFDLTSRDRQVADHVRGWLWPVWDQLAFTDSELSPQPSESVTPQSRQIPQPPEVSRLLLLLADPDTSPQLLSEVLWASGWEQFPAADRRRLRPLLLHHPDPLVRERATVALQDWSDTNGLLALVADADFGVRKSAMYYLGLVPHSRDLAALAWDHMHRPDVFGVHATETLGTFVAHAGSAHAVPKLARIAFETRRPESLRVAAVHHLGHTASKVQIQDLARILGEQPAVTWALHIAVIEASANAGLTCEEAEQLRGTDNLHVQAALAKIVT